MAELAQAGALPKSAVEHLQMLKLIELGDATGLAELMRRHIGHVRGSWAGRRERNDADTETDIDA